MDHPNDVFSTTEMKSEPGLCSEKEIDRKMILSVGLAHTFTAASTILG